LQTAGFASTDPKVSNTRAFAAQGLKLALQMRASGMRVTQQEIQWFRQAAAGDTNVTPEALRSMLDVMQKGEEGKFTAYNNRAKTVATLAQKDSAYSPVAAMYPMKDVPQYNPTAVTAPAPPKFEVGKQYTSNGVTKTYQADGTWK
jgi:hypothetical protein